MANLYQPHFSLSCLKRKSIYFRPFHWQQVTESKEVKSKKWLRKTLPWLKSFLLRCIENLWNNNIIIILSYRIVIVPYHTTGNIRRWEKGSYLVYDVEYCCSVCFTGITYQSMLGFYWWSCYKNWSHIWSYQKLQGNILSIMESSSHRE